MPLPNKYTDVYDACRQPAWAEEPIAEPALCLVCGQVRATFHSRPPP